MLSLPLDTLAFIVEKAREYDVEVPRDADEDGSNAADDGESEVLFDTADNPAAQELREAIDGLNIDQQAELLALTWLGRGDFGPDDWHDGLRDARSVASTQESRYLMGTPMLADYLAEGAAALGLELPELE